MKHTLHLIIIYSLLAVAVGCAGRGGGARQTASADDSLQTVPFRYARLIHIERQDGCTLVRVDNPWKAGKTLHSYLLVPCDAPLPQPLPSGVTLVRTPLRRSVIFTSVHAALVAQLDAQGQVAGVADRKYMKVPFVVEGCRNGTLTDCGDGMNPLVEKIIDAAADAILLSPFENSGGYGRLEDISIPLIECAEYMEHSPLARAEWMRFYGMLYGKEHAADSLFALVDSSYHALKTLAETSRVRLSVLMDKQTGSVWYVPGGCSTIGQMLADAKASYPFADDDHSGSLPLPFEAVLERSGECDVWLFRYDSSQPMTRRQLLGEQPGYSQLRPVRERRLYGCNVTTSMFYEESPFRPDLLLQDFIQILHPDLQGLPPLRYYEKIME